MTAGSVFGWRAGHDGKSKPTGQDLSDVPRIRRIFTALLAPGTGKRWFEWRYHSDTKVLMLPRSLFSLKLSPRFPQCLLKHATAFLDLKGIDLNQDRHGLGVGPFNGLGLSEKSVYVVGSNPQRLKKPSLSVRLLKF